MGRAILTDIEGTTSSIAFVKEVLFPANEEQKQVAEAYIRQLNEAGVFTAPIATRLEPLDTFYKAEDYHQNYAALNPGQPYVEAVAMPKVDKLRKYYGNQLKR